MSENTYKRLSRKGRRRARIICEIENIILMFLIASGAFIGANMIGLICKLIGV